ncbi:scavenger receptor cysteine-rich domain superfamily protein-like isoform X5 [Pecten maximus]|uniref:scavenger receptor cysteine-rich domain superfamily protein-like isoform X5 n=1 Tax=Pecten maximus TaxID=6579 RepID=UPI0014580D09|nr:scavenger receptor cysteine-rich domain superfamily protein-like isoform X5 [Pecten maximus]
MKNNSMGAIQFCLLILVVVSTESTESVKFSVRLVNGTKRSGMVEQLLGSTWKSLCGGVCWTAENARVTCKELGFQGGSRPSEDRGIIGDDTPGRYKCQGNENVLRNCYQISSCSPTQCKYGAQVICQDAVRLIDHEPFGNKRIEFFKQNSKKKWKWGGLCSKCWTGTNSNVVCHQYGLRSGEVKETETIKKNQNIWHHVQFNCSGDEKHLSDCPRSNQECQNCGNDEAIINCIQKEPSYNEKCDNKTGCKNGLICKDNVCKCGDDTTSFWNVDQMKCTQKPSYNEKCDNKTGCKNGLICKDNVCKCGDDTTSFWNVDQMKCTQKHSYNAKCDNKTVCKNGLICKDNVCKCGDESTSFWNDDQMICTKKQSNNVTCGNQPICLNGSICKDDVCKCENETSLVWNVDERKCTKKLDFNETCTIRTECMRGLICAVNNVCRCENETSSYWNTDKDACTERSSLGENCTLYMFASCKDTLECKEDDILGAVCRKKNEDVSSGKIDGDRENQVLWPIFVGVSIAVLFIILIVAVVVRWFKKKRRNASKYEQDVSYHHRQPLDYSEPVLNLSDENLNENQENNASEDGLYSLAQSNIIVSVPAPTTTKMTKTDEYGYGVLGGRILENDDDGLYSHSKQWTNTGEYDMFVRKDSDTDVNNLYDHTRGIQQENLYDEFK